MSIKQSVNCSESEIVRSEQEIFEKMKQVLVKRRTDRSVEDLKFLSQQFKNYKFFKELGIVRKEMIEICNSLDFEMQESDSYVMKHGDEGDSFKLVIKGKVTVWIPMKIESMVNQIEELRSAALDSINLIDYSDELLFDLQVYFDPWKIDDDKETDYATFSDFEDLIDQDLDYDDRIFVWNAYKIKRAIDIVRRFEDRYPNLFADGVLE